MRCTEPKRRSTARLEYDGADGIVFGHLAGSRDGVGCQADDVAELKAAFREAVADDIETGAKIGKAPQRACSGKLRLRVDPSRTPRPPASQSPPPSPPRTREEARLPNDATSADSAGATLLCHPVSGPRMAADGEVS